MMRLLSRRSLVCLSITAFWLVMMGLLARREWASAPPLADENRMAVEEISEPRLSRLGIFLDGRKIGAAQIDYVPMPNRSTTIRMHIQLTEAGSLGEGLEAGATMSLGPDKKLSSFTARFGSGEAAYVLRGTVIRGELQIEYALGGQTSLQRMPFREDTLFSSSLTPFLGGVKVPPGEILPLALWNPITRRMDTAWIENKGKTRLLWHGRWLTPERLELSYNSLSLSAWVTERGDVLRQEAPFGLVLEKEED